MDLTAQTLSNAYNPTTRPQARRIVDVEDMAVLDRWSRTREFNDVPHDKFVATVLAAQKDMNTADTALDLCHRRYRRNDTPPPADLIKVLLETPTDGLLNRPPYWEETTLLYLGKHKASAEHGGGLLLKAAHAGCLQDVLGKMLETNPVSSEVWKAVVLAVAQAKDDWRILGQEMRKCKDYFSEEVVELIHEHVKTRDPKVLAPRVAAVLPNDLPVVMQWMSLCEAQKTDVAVKLLDNMMSVAGSQPFDIEYWQSRLDDACDAMQEVPELAKAWLDLYRASLHFEIGEMLWQRGNESFKVGFVEFADEKEYRDSLERWLEDPDTKIVGKGELLGKIRTDREWERRKDGHIWHAELVKMLYESHMFKSVGVERKVGGKSVDILLEDECGKDIHIEAWDGMTEMTHSIRRMFQTGKRFNINKLGQRGGEDAVFGWKYANRWLNGKVLQLPQTGRNFVVAPHTQHELIWQSMDGVDLKDNTCAIQIMRPNALVWCKDHECMEAVARLISKALGCEYCPMPQQEQFPSSALNMP